MVSVFGLVLSRDERCVRTKLFFRCRISHRFISHKPLKVLTHSVFSVEEGCDVKKSYKEHEILHLALTARATKRLADLKTPEFIPHITLLGGFEVIDVEDESKNSLVLNELKAAFQSFDD